MAVAAFFVALIGSTLPASAHVNFVGSMPANVSTVDGPVTRIVLEYSGTSDPISDDFLIQDSSGTSQPIASVGNDGDTKVVVTTVNALPSGRNKVSWALRGTDGHKMTGTISFTVAAATSSSTTSTVTASPSTPSVQPVEVDLTESEATSTTSGPSGTDSAEMIATAGRWLVYVMILFTVGSLAYLVLVHRGTRREGRGIVFLIRRSAILVIVGSTMEWFAQLAVYGSGSITDVVSPTAWGDLLSTSFALGTLCRIIGAALVLRFVPIEVVAEDPIDYANLDDYDLFGELASPSPSPSPTATAVVSEPDTRLARVRVESGPLAFVGALLLVLSESFIGHTASVEPRALVLVSDAVHMMAAAVWVAGVWLLAWTFWQRTRRGESLDARLVATRFSITATWALVAVAISGTALGWAILGSPGRLFTTEFGRMLLIKVALVAVIGAIGLHNRRTLLPALEQPGIDVRFYRTIIIESALFVAVLVATALLVVANPVP
ncbi:Copper resistance protein D [Acidimicrobiia bacterium]